MHVVKESVKFGLEDENRRPTNEQIELFAEESAKIGECFFWNFKCMKSGQHELGTIKKFKSA